MFPAHNKYAVSPCVYKTGEASEVCILPAARTFAFFADRDYIVMVSGVNDDEAWYHEPTAWTRYDLRVMITSFLIQTDLREFFRVALHPHRLFFLHFLV